MLVLLALLLSGCGSGEDLRARYSLERDLWNAQRIERRINIDLQGASEREIKFAIRAFEGIVAKADLEGKDLKGWDPGVIKDIKRIGVLSKIALANLYFITDKYYLAESYYKSSLDDENLPFMSRMNARLNLARSFYLMGSQDSLRIECEAIFRDIVGEEDFWRSRARINDSFLNIPLVLLRIYRSRGDTEKVEELGETAERFYRKITLVWPGEMIAEKARLQMVNLYLIEGRWREAVRTIDDLMDSSFGRAMQPRLLLMKAKIYLNGMGDRAKAKATLKRILKDSESMDGYYAAKFELANISFLEGGEAEAIEMLKEIEKSSDASPEVRTNAMLVRALYLEKHDKWNEARLILKRIQSLYPETMAALKAPLLMTIHYVNGGDTVLARKNLETAREFYLTLLEKKWGLAQRSLFVQDFLVENYIAAGLPEEAARILEEKSSGWGWSNAAGAMLKSAGIYAELLGDKEKAAELLKKCIALYPETRYAKEAAGLLDRLAGPASRSVSSGRNEK